MVARNVRTNQDNTFETIIKSLQPFMSSYGISNDRRVKLRVTDAADTGLLEAALNNSGGKASRVRNVVFVRFDDSMTNADVRKIVSSAFGEAQDEDAPVDFDFSAMPGELDETPGAFGVDQG